MPWFNYPAISFRGSSYLPDNNKKTQEYDVVIVSGDAYVDHPSFAAAVIYRRLQGLGLKVAVIAQPDWNKDDDFTVWGRPSLFFAILPGAMDSMVSNYTSARKPRSKDRLSPDSVPGLRPKRAVQVYTQKIRQLYSGVNIIIGGIEASLRRFVHYDYWENRLKDPILFNAPADFLVYGMAESVLEKIVNWFKSNLKDEIPQIAQTCIRVRHDSWRQWLKDNYEILPTFFECCEKPEAFIRLSKSLDSSVKPGGKILIQQHPKGDVICFPPDLSDLMSEPEIMGKLNFNRRSHPIYKNPIAGLEPVQFSIQAHRGCLGTCSFCALSLHQGRIIRSRAPEDIIAEASRFVDHPDFKGIISDVGGPSVNMYGWECNIDSCQRRECIYPTNCLNLKHSLRPLQNLLKSVIAVNGIRKVFLGSGLRFDLIRANEWPIFEYIVFNHVSGQLKVAPEHFDKRVLSLMRKGENADFADFANRFYQSCRKNGKKLFLVPYLMTSFPGCENSDDKLASRIKELSLVHEQIQEFTPTPGSLATAMFYTGLDLNANPIKVKKTDSERMKARKQIQGTNSFSNNKSFFSDKKSFDSKNRDKFPKKPRR